MYGNRQSTVHAEVMKGEPREQQILETPNQVYPRIPSADSTGAYHEGGDVATRLVRDAGVWHLDAGG